MESVNFEVWMNRICCSFHIIFKHLLSNWRVAKRFFIVFLNFCIEIWIEVFNLKYQCVQFVIKESWRSHLRLSFKHVELLAKKFSRSSNFDKTAHFQEKINWKCTFFEKYLKNFNVFWNTLFLSFPKKHLSVKKMMLACKIYFSL